MVNQQGRTVGRDFIAGLVVGEGSFVLGVHKLRGDKIRIKPQFNLQMNDGTTVQLVYESLRGNGIGAHMYHRPNRGCWTLQVAGFGRMRKLIDFLMPSLTGDKRVSASLVNQFIASRLEKATGAAYDEAELNLVRKLRSANGQRSGRKNPL